MLLTPIDTLKTTQQTRGGVEGLKLLRERIGEHGIGCLFWGALGTAGATFVGHCELDNARRLSGTDADVIVCDRSLVRRELPFLAFQKLGADSVWLIDVQLPGSDAPPLANTRPEAIRTSPLQMSFVQPLTRVETSVYRFCCVRRVGYDLEWVESDQDVSTGP